MHLVNSGLSLHTLINIHYLKSTVPVEHVVQTLPHQTLQGYSSEMGGVYEYTVVWHHKHAAVPYKWTLDCYELVHMSRIAQYQVQLRDAREALNCSKAEKREASAKNRQQQARVDTERRRVWREQFMACADDLADFPYKSHLSLMRSLSEECRRYINCVKEPRVALSRALAVIQHGGQLPAVSHCSNTCQQKTA